MMQPLLSINLGIYNRSRRFIYITVTTLFFHDIELFFYQVLNCDSRSLFNNDVFSAEYSMVFSLYCQIPVHIFFMGTLHLCAVRGSKQIEFNGFVFARRSRWSFLPIYCLCFVFVKSWKSKIEKSLFQIPSTQF